MIPSPFRPHRITTTTKVVRKVSKMDPNAPPCSTFRKNASGNNFRPTIKMNPKRFIVDDASIQRMKQLEQQQKDARRRRRPPPLISSSSSLSSLSSIESVTDEPTLHKSTSTSFTFCNLPLTTTLPILVFIDMFAVALVVPLLFQYYQSAGVTSAGQRELITCIFSLAQIVGGLLLGALIDANWIRRRTILYLSFAGSAVAYALIAIGGFQALIASRTLVGLVKQTMTITKTMLTRCTHETNRAQHMGRLSASATAAWVLGPSVGAVLFKYVDPRAPPMLASAFFVLNMVIAALVLPPEDSEEDDVEEEVGIPTNTDSSSKPSCPANCQAATYHQTTQKCQSCTISFLSNLKSCFSSSALGSVVCASLVVTWVTRATNSNNLSTFYEDLYGLEPHHRGYISSYQQILGFFIESCFIAPVLQWSGGERKATCWYAFFLAIAIGLQTLYPSSLTLFLGLVCPVTSLAYSILFTSLQTLVTTAAPVESIFSVLAAMDVLQNAVSVTVPFYRTVLFAKLTAGNRTSSLTMASSMEGDPDPGAWLLSCTIHWFLAAAALGSLLVLKKENQGHANGKRAVPKKTS
jgi:MFS family permease